MVKGFGVVAYFDKGLEDRLKKLWDKLAEEDIESTTPAIGGRPHISLAVVESMDAGTFRAVLKEFSMTTNPIEILFSAVGFFPYNEGLIFVAPAARKELIDYHYRFHELLRKHHVISNEHYQPGKWIPHCTVATNIPAENSAVALRICRQSDVFTEGTLTEICLAQFDPVQELYRFPLGRQNSLLL